MARGFALHMSESDTKDKQPALPLRGPGSSPAPLGHQHGGAVPSMAGFDQATHPQGQEGYSMGWLSEALEVTGRPSRRGARLRGNGKGVMLAQLGAGWWCNGSRIGTLRDQKEVLRGLAPL
jgi:hypothetical protein